MLMNGKPTMRPSKGLPDRARAEDIAVQGLSFLAATPERLGRFLETSGLAPEAVRSAVQSAAFFVGVLDYLVSEDELLLRFAAEVGLKPEIVMQARQILSPAEFSD
jgi:Protein of unknown function (DUF3572)